MIFFLFTLLSIGMPDHAKFFFIIQNRSSTKLFISELEAKLENNNDERRLLVERCVTSEKDNEGLRERVAEQRRKLEDLQAALQEMGRENQTLQVSIIIKIITAFIKRFMHEKLKVLYAGSWKGHVNHSTFLNSQGALQRRCHYKRCIILAYCQLSGTCFTHE